MHVRRFSPVLIASDRPQAAHLPIIMQINVNQFAILQFNKVQQNYNSRDRYLCMQCAVFSVLVNLPVFIMQYNDNCYKRKAASNANSSQPTSQRGSPVSFALNTRQNLVKQRALVIEALFVLFRQSNI